MIPKRLLRIIMVSIIVVGVLGGGGYLWYLDNKQAISQEQLTQSIIGKAKRNQSKDETQRLRDWNSFIDIPVPKECFLTASQSCFPRITFTENAGVGQFIISLPLGGTLGGNLEKKTIRSIMLGDTDFKNMLFILSLSPANKNGFLVDDWIDHAMEVNMNPLITSEILKLLLKEDLQNLSDITIQGADPVSFSRSFGGMAIFEPKIVKELSSSYIAFSSSSESTPLSSQSYLQSPAFPILRNSTFSPMQKSLLLYFFTNLTKEAYLSFVNSFNAHVSTEIGVFPIKLVNTKEEFQIQGIPPGFLFCRTNNKQTLQCERDATKSITCYASSGQKACQANYTLD